MLYLIEDLRIHFSQRPENRNFSKPKDMNLFQKEAENIINPTKRDETRRKITSNGLNQKGYRGFIQDSFSSQ